MGHMSETQDTGTQPAPQGETAPQPAENTAPTTGTEQTPAATPAPQTNTEEAPKPRPWFEKRIAETAFEAREERRQKEAAIAYARQLEARLQPQQEAAQQPPPGYVPVSEIARVAAQQREAERFTDACNDVADFGSAKFPDFNEAVSTFAMLGGPPPALLEAVTALGKEDGARVYYELGKNPDEASRLLALSPARMAVEVAKMAAKPAAAPRVSAVPEPVVPIGSGNARTEANPARMSDAQWRDWFGKKYQR